MRDLVEVLRLPIDLVSLLLDFETDVFGLSVFAAAAPLWETANASLQPAQSTTLNLARVSQTLTVSMIAGVPPDCSVLRVTAV